MNQGTCSSTTVVYTGIKEVSAPLSTPAEGPELSPVPHLQFMFPVTIIHSYLGGKKIIDYFSSIVQHPAWNTETVGLDPWAAQLNRLKSTHRLRPSSAQSPSCPWEHKDISGSHFVPGSLDRRIGFILFFHQGKDQLGAGKPKPARPAAAAALGYFWFRDFASLCQRYFSFPFPDGPSLQKEKSASGFVRHRNCFFHRVLWLNSCSSASYQWLMLAILSRKLIFIYL